MIESDQLHLVLGKGFQGRRIKWSAIFGSIKDTSYRQDNREKGYTILDRGSTESGGQFTPPHFLECGVKSMLFDPNFFMQKSMVGSLFVEALNVNVVVFLR